MKWQKILTKQFLIKEYIKNKKSYLKISKSINCSPKVIEYYMKKYNIKARTNTESHSGSLNYMFGKKLFGKDNGNFGKKHPGMNKGIPKTEEHRKKLRENHANYFGKNNPNWQGGSSFEPYSFDFNIKLKETIRKRDKYICQKCGIKQKDNIIGNKQQKLDIHHINYNKQNCKEDNLIALCHKCNTKVNFNRDYYYAYFIYIYNGK